MESADDPAVCMYRMKGVRDSFVFSQLKSRMLSENAWYVPACSTTVVRRALTSPYYPLKSILLTSEHLAELAEKIESALHRRRALIRAYRSLEERVRQARVTAKDGMNGDGKPAPAPSCDSDRPSTMDSTDNDDVEVLVVTEKQFGDILGMPVNNKQCCAALMDIRMPPIHTLLASLPAGGCMSCESPCGQSKCGACRRSSGETECAADTDGSCDLLCSDKFFPMLVVDDVQSSDNIGTLMRTAMSLGVNSILLSPVSYAAVNARSARVSMGAMFHLRLLQCTDTRSSVWSSRSQASRPGQSVLAATLQQIKRVFPVCAILGTSPRGDPRILFRASDWIHSCCKSRLQLSEQPSNGEGENDASGHRDGTPDVFRRANKSGKTTDDIEERHVRWLLVVGNEKKGCSEEVLKACDGVAAIAQARGDSLNVSTAAAVALYCLQQESLTKLRTHIPFVPDEELDGDQL